MHAQHTQHPQVRQGYRSPRVLQRSQKFAPQSGHRQTPFQGFTLAFRCPEEVEERIADMTFKRFAPNTITDADELREQLAVTRERGFAEEIEESEAGVRCMAVPILDHLGKSMAAISMSFPLFRFEESRRSEYAGLLMEVGREVSAQMGYSGQAIG